MHFNYRFLLILPVSFLLISCNRSTSVHSYTEIFKDDGRRFMAMREKNNPSMPNDEIHAGLLENMPNDDIHTKLTSTNPKNPAMEMPMDPNMKKSLEASMDTTPLIWKTPDNWNEQKGSGMRLATFNSGEGTEQIETTIVSLGGQAGGLSSNILRWINQLQLPVPNDAALQTFVDTQEKIKTKDAMDGVLVDLTQLQKDAPATTASMIAAIIDKSDAQIFVKMTGTKNAVLKNKEKLKSLVESIQVNK